MARKKKSSPIYQFLFKSRMGFYSLSIAVVILMFSAIKMYSQPEVGVLGKSTEHESEEQKERHEEEREERKQEINHELRAEPGKVKLKFESEDNQVKRKIEIEQEDHESEDEDLDEIEEEIELNFEEETETEIATDTPQVEIRKNNVKARTGFPLSIDLATNQLIVTRPDGTTKAVSVLPDKAVQNFMDHKKINLLNVQDPGTGTGSAGTTPDSDVTSSSENSQDTKISIVERDDKLVYEIKAKKKLKLLGLIPITADTTGYVDTETGEVVDQEEPLLTKFLNIISL